MNNAELYHKGNSLQKRDAIECLKEYAKKIKWKNYGDKILDIGCGDGSVTTDILAKFLPHNFKQVVGCDISEKMVQFANDHHGNEQTTFRILDIEEDLPDELSDSFDHAFSFYTLHWIRHQEIAFKNIYRSLVEGGDCLLMFLGHMPMFDIYRVLSQSSKWCPWMKDVDRYISPYHDSLEPEKEIRRLMAKVGFKNIDVRCKEKSFVFDNVDTIKKAVMAVNPFNIPKDISDEFMEDYLDVMRDMRFMDETNNNISEPVNVKTNYTLLIAYGNK